MRRKPTPIDHYDGVIRSMLARRGEVGAVLALCVNRVTAWNSGADAFRTGGVALRIMER